MMNPIEGGTYDIEPNTLSLVDAAKFYANKGMKVFPLQPNSKVPLKNWSWKKACTSDPELIEAWWAQHPTANIGMVTGGVNNVMVMDVDMKKGQNGVASYEALAQETYEGLVQDTPTGGKHLIFKYMKGLKNFTHQGDFSGLDMRTDNGYIVVAPSTVPEGRYQWSQLGRVPDMPGRVWGACERWSAGIQAHEVDMPDMVEELPPLNTLGLKEKHLDYLREGDTSAWGGDESVAIYGVSSALMHKVKDVALVYSVMLDNPFAYACAERHTVGHPERWMWKYGIGKAVLSYQQFSGDIKVSDYFSPVETTPANTDPVSTQTDFFVGIREGLATRLKPPEWVVEGIMETGQVGVLYGDSTVGKTFALLDLGLHIAADRKWHNKRVYRPGSVLMITSEGERALWRRIEAWWQHYNAMHKKDTSFKPVSPESIDAGGFFVSRKGVDLLDLETLKPVNELVSSMSVAPSLIIVDTLASNMLGDENRSDDVSRFINNCKAMANTWGSTVLIAHHSGLNVKDRMRGSSAIFSGVDFVLQLDRVEKALVPTVELSTKKSKDGECSNPLYFEMEVQYLIDVPDQNGNPSTSLALKQVSKANSLVDAAEQTRFTKVQADVLNLAMETIEDKRDMGQSTMPYASFDEIYEEYKVWCHDERKNCTKDGLQKILSKLVRAGYLDIDPDQKTLWYLFPKPEKEG